MVLARDLYFCNSLQGKDYLCVCYPDLYAAVEMRPLLFCVRLSEFIFFSINL